MRNYSVGVLEFEVIVRTCYCLIANSRSVHVEPEVDTEYYNKKLKQVDIRQG